MRITLPVLTLLSATNVFSHILPGRKALYRRSEETLTWTDSCKEEISSKKEYHDCIYDDITASNYSALCEAFKTPECKKFFDDPDSVFPSCKNDPAFKAVFSDPDVKEYDKHTRNYVCTFDDDGNLCPTAKAAISTGIFFQSTFDDACQSKSCVEAGIDMYTYISDNYDALNESGNIEYGSKTSFASIVDDLKSEKCNRILNGQTDSSSDSLWSSSSDSLSSSSGSSSNKPSGSISDDSKSGSQATYKIGTSLLFTLMGVLLLL